MRVDEPATLRSDDGDGDRATFLELFFDLVYVFALTRISARAFEDWPWRAARPPGRR